MTQTDDWRKVTLSQSQYIKDILEYHGMANCHPVKTPMESGLSLPVLIEPEVDVTTYQQFIGSLMYAMVCTRPNISYVADIIACHVSALGHIHMKAVKHICYDSELLTRSNYDRNPRQPCILTSPPARGSG